MSEKIVQLNAEIIKGQIREFGPRQHGGGPHRDVSGGRFRAPGRGHHGRPVGQQGFALTISELNKKAYVHIEDWRNRPLQGGRYPYVYVDGIYLRRNWGGEYENVAVLVAIAVNEDGFREVLGAAEGMKQDKAGWVSFFQWLRGRGLDGVKLVVGDKRLGMLEAVGEVFPDAKYQRCTVHFYRNVFSVVPKSKVKIVAKMLKAIHA